MAASETSSSAITIGLALIETIFCTYFIFSLRGNLRRLEEAAFETKESELPEKLEEVLNRAKLREHFEKSRDGKGQDRIENLEELVNATRQFEVPPDEEQLTGLDAFLAHAALEAGDNQAEAYEDSVQLMTMHSAKN